MTIVIKSQSTSLKNLFNIQIKWFHEFFMIFARYSEWFHITERTVMIQTDQTNLPIYRSLSTCLLWEPLPCPCWLASLMGIPTCTETATHCHVSQKYLISTMHKGKWTKTGSRELNPLWLLLPAKLSCDFTLTWSQRDSAVYSLDLLLESLYAHLHVKEMYRRGISATVWKDEIILR